MRELAAEFISKGHKHEQLKRTGEGYTKHYALYKRWSLATEPDHHPHFEVIRIGQQQAGEMTIGGKTVQLEERETYPTERTWGLDGWTFLAKSKAEQKYLALLKRSSETKPE